jgi:hypothetical protein
MNSPSLDSPGSLVESNTQYHICSLPTEILCAVFRDVAAAPHTVHLAHVCRVFRAAALSDPFLWADVNLAYLDLSRWQLALSGDVPLRIRVDEGPDKPKRPEHDKERAVAVAAVWSTLLDDHAGRIATLHFRLSDHYDAISALTFLPGLLRQPVTFPCTSHVHVHFVDRRERGNDRLVGALFTHHFPALRHVHLVNITANLKRSIAWPRLTHLSIDGTNLISCPELSKFPGLVQLTLKNLEKSFPAFHYAFALPQLRDLTVHGSYGKVNGLFRHVDTPALVSVDIRVSDGHMLHKVPVYAQALARLFHVPNQRHVLFAYTSQDPYEWAFDLVTTAQRLRVSTYTHSYYRRREGYLISPVQCLASLWIHFGPALLDAITSLRVHMEWYMEDLRPVVRAFGPVASVTDVRADERWLLALLDIRGSTPEIMPALCALYVHGGIDLWNTERSSIRALSTP